MMKCDADIPYGNKFSTDMLFIRSSLSEKGILMEADEVDWRLKVTATVAEDTVLPWNGHEIKMGDRIKVVSVVDLPKKRTLILPVPSLTALYISNSEKSWKKYRAIRKERKLILL